MLFTRFSKFGVIVLERFSEMLFDFFWWVIWFDFQWKKFVNWLSAIWLPNLIYGINVNVCVCKEIKREYLEIRLFLIGANGILSSFMGFSLFFLMVEVATKIIEK